MERLISMTEYTSVKGYEGIYSISKCGVLKSDSKVIGKRKLKEKILKDRINFHGYKSCVLRKNEKSKYLTIHRLVAINFIPNPENKPQVNHIDGNKLNNHIDNLEWCTNLENIRHAWKTGLFKKRIGEDSPTAKLSEIDINEIKKLKGHITNKEIASLFNISKSHAGKILTGKVWIHVF